MELALCQPSFRSILIECLSCKYSVIADMLLTISVVQSNTYVSLITYVEKGGELKLTYLPKGKECILDESGSITPKNRQIAKVGRVINNLIDCFTPDNYFKDRITAKDIEEFVYLLFSVYQNNKKEIIFKLVTGDDIKKYYHYKHYYGDGGGILHNSCMKHDGCQDFFKIYTENPDCQMLIAFTEDSLKEDKIIGRALVWKKDNQLYVDRIYYLSDRYLGIFMNYIKSNLWNYKTNNTYGDNQEFMVYRPNKGGYDSIEDFEISFKYDQIYDYFPYADTLQYLNPLTFELSNIAFSGMFYKLISTDGEFDRTSGHCARCNRHIDEDDMIEIGNDIYCNDCAVYDEYNDNYCLRDESIIIIIHNDRPCRVSENTDHILFEFNDNTLPIINSNSYIINAINIKEEEKEKYVLDDQKEYALLKDKFNLFYSRLMSF